MLLPKVTKAVAFLYLLMSVSRSTYQGMISFYIRFSLYYDFSSEVPLEHQFLDGDYIVYIREDTKGGYDVTCVIKLYETIAVQRLPSIRLCGNCLEWLELKTAYGGISFLRPFLLAVMRFPSVNMPNEQTLAVLPCRHQTTGESGTDDLGRLSLKHINPVDIPWHPGDV